MQWGAEGQSEGQAAVLNAFEYKTFDMISKSRDSEAKPGFKSQAVNLCSPMDCSMLGSSVLHYLPEFSQIYVH